MSKEYNHKHIKIICEECKSDNILVDQYHGETYCLHCGLVLQDTTLFKITKAIEKEEMKNRQLNRLWRKIKNPNIYNFGGRGKTK